MSKNYKKKEMTPYKSLKSVFKQIKNKIIKTKNSEKNASEKKMYHACYAHFWVEK